MTKTKWNSAAAAPKEHTRQSCADGLRNLLFSWLLAVTLEFLLVPSAARDLSQTDALTHMSFLRVVLITLGGTALLSVLSHWKDTACYVRYAMAADFAVLSVLTGIYSHGVGFWLACAGVLAAMLVYAGLHWRHDAAAKPAAPAKKPYVWALAGLAAAFCAFLCAWSISRVLSFCAPTFDFGIFTQMFHNMKTTGLPNTTVERDGLLSHFAVHVSPIYYLMLPIYALIPSPLTLQVLQAVVMASAVIPLWKLGRLHGLRDWQRLLLCAVLLLYPAYAGGVGYDLHENCFLTPLLLWLFYGVDKQAPLLIGVSALLTLMVKEDAAVFVAVVGLWLLVRGISCHEKPDRWQLCTGGLLLAAALGWFLATTGFLAQCGDGVMTYRYKNFMYDDSGSLFTVVKAVLMHPMKALAECVEPEKLQFIAYTLLPLLGLPLLTRRYERLLLLIPYLLLNLMSDYPYQHDLFFQYSYGPIAFMLYLTAVNLSDLSVDGKKTAALAAAVAVSAGCFFATVVPTAMVYPQRLQAYSDYYQSLREALATVPDGASVTASTFFTVHLSKRQTLYDIRYCTPAHVLETEYVVLQDSAAEDFTNFDTDGKCNGLENLKTFLEKNGYVKELTVPDRITIYHRTA